MEQNNPYIVKQKLSLKNLKDIQITSDCQLKTANGSEVTFNGIKLGKGIKCVELVLAAQKYPEVTIEYNKHLIPDDLCETLGLEQSTSPQV